MGGAGKSASDPVLAALWGLVAECLWLCCCEQYLRWVPQACGWQSCNVVLGRDVIQRHRCKVCELLGMKVCGLLGELAVKGVAPSSAQVFFAQVFRR